MTGLALDHAIPILSISLKHDPRIAPGDRRSFAHAAAEEKEGQGLSQGAILDSEIVVLIQFAALFRGQQKIPMSTRSGEFVSLRELIDEVGVDAARYFYALRKSDQHLDFDLNLAKAKNNENPVFYVQYAHARCSSLMSKWKGKKEELISFSKQANLDKPDELLIMQKLAEYPDVLKKCCQDLIIHNVPTYLREVSYLLHRYYTTTQVLSADEPERSARVALIAAVKQVLNNGLSLLGVSAPDKM